MVDYTLRLWADNCNYIHPGHYAKCPLCELDQLRARIAELDAEVAHLKKNSGRPDMLKLYFGVK